MKVDIYQSGIKREKFLVVPAGTDVSGTALGITDPDFSSAAPFLGGIELVPGRIGLNAEAAKKDIEEKSHHIFSIRVVIEVPIKKDK